MIFASKLKKPIIGGSPPHISCGGGLSALSLSNIKVNLGISKGNSGVTTLINTNDLSTVTPTIGGIVTYGDLDIVFNSFYRDNSTSTWGVLLDFFRTGTSEIVTHQSININLSITDGNNLYSSYSNVFEVYGYDIGNGVAFSPNTNVNFEIVLIPFTDYITGNQQNAVSNCMLLHKPFTNEVHVYNLVGTQGNISYKDSITNAVYSLTGQNFVTCQLGNLNVVQTIKLNNGSTCTTILAQDTGIVWLPTFTNTSSCPLTCGDGCVNNTTPQINTVIDYTLVNTFNLGNTKVFLTQFMYHDVIFELFDSSGNRTNTQQSQYVTPTPAQWLATPATYLVPVNYTFTLNSLGVNTVKITQDFFVDSNIDIEIFSCYEALIFNSCNFWTIDKTGTCGDLLLNNWQTTPISVNIASLQDDLTWLSISTTTVNGLTNLDISFSTNGIFLITVTDPNNLSYIGYYTVANFCNLETCWLNYLQQVICCKPKDNCHTKEQYDFFAFMINAHTFFMALNDEFTFNYIYTSLSDLNNRLTTLYTLSSFIKRFDDYCSECEPECLPCKKNDKD